MKSLVSFGDKFWLYSAVLCLAGFLFNFIAVFPGLMSVDSLYLYNMGVDWVFSDYHHPFISVLMGLGRFIRNDPSPYLFFQLSLYWGGVYLFTQALYKQIGKWAILVPCIGFLPFNLSLSGYLHKTPLLSVCFLFSFSWMYLCYSRNKRIGLFQGISLSIVLFLGAVIRGYSYLAALPLVAFMLWLFLKKGKNLWYDIIRVAIFSLIFTVVFIGLNQFLVYNVLQAKKTYKHQILYTFDMAGIYALTGNIYAGEFLKKQYKDWKNAKKLYDEKMAFDPWRIISMYTMTENPVAVKKMQAEWFRAVSENFPTYLEFRKTVVLKTFGITAKASAYKSFSQRHKRNIHHLVKYDSVFWTLFKNYILSVNTAFFMMPWFWSGLNVLFSIIALVLVTRPRYRELILPHCLLLVSGLLLLAPYLLICLSGDTRFTYWVTIATSFGGFGVLSTLVTSHTGKSPPNERDPFPAGY